MVKILSFNSTRNRVSINLNASCITYLSLLTSLATILFMKVCTRQSRQLVQETKSDEKLAGLVVVPQKINVLNRILAVKKPQNQTKNAFSFVFIRKETSIKGEGKTAFFHRLHPISKNEKASFRRGKWCYHSIRI